MDEFEHIDMTKSVDIPSLGYKHAFGIKRWDMKQHCQTSK